MLTIERHYGAFIVRGGDYGDGEGTLVQTDWDYPGVARDFGWSLRRVQKINGETRHLKRQPRRLAMEWPGRCDHSGTDGTINCPDCGVTALAFICAAGEFLNSKC